MAVPNIFGTATAAIPLSQLDTNFATAITLGNTAVYLGNTTTSLGNVTLTNVTISSGNVTLTGANVSGTANISTLIVTGNQTSLGNVAITGNISANIVTVAAGAVGTPSITTTGDTNTGIFFPAADTIAFAEGGAESMRITSTGDVGIGTTSPSTQLQMNSGAATYSDQLRIRNTNFGNADIGVGSGIMAIATDMSNIAFYTSSNLGTTGSSLPNNERMRIDSSGNVGIGTVSPNVKLEVSGPDTVAGAGIRLSRAADTTNFWDIFRDGTTGILNFKQYGASASSMLLDTSNNLLFGTTQASATNTQGMYLKSGATDTYAAIGHATGVGSGNAYMVFLYNGGTIGTITQNGTTGVLYNLTSDYRLKNDQQPLTGAKDFIMALKPKKWQWWDGSGEGVGFVAHEFMEVAKYSGQGEKDAVDENGKPKYQSIQPSSSEVMANMVSLMQEQQALITALTARITALENK